MAFVVAMKDVFWGLAEFTAASTESAFKQVAEAQGIKTGEVMQLFRVCLTGVAGGPALFEMCALLGKAESADRLERALATIKTQ